MWWSPFIYCAWVGGCWLIISDQEDESLENSSNEKRYVTGFEKTWLPCTVININFNYLNYYNSGRETDSCMKFAMVL